jgi:hypothetical protein
VRGQQLNLYMTEGRFAVATEPGALPERTARILPVASVPAPVAATQPATVAMAQPAMEPQAVLPDTAGPLPWLAVTGML